MLLQRLAETWSALAATRSRIAKRELIAGVLADVGPDDELETVVAYLIGSLRQRRTGVGARSLVRLPPPAADASLTVAEVDATFGRIAGLAGAGSVAARADAVAELFGRATAAEQPFLRGLVFGELRQGASEAAVQDALATTYGVPLAAVRRAAMLRSSTVAAAALLHTGGLAALEAVGLEVGTAVQPMLAASEPDPVAAVARTGLPALVDAKLDGIRVQVHRDGDEVRVYTRSLDDITARLPEVVAAVRALPHARVVLDGEVLALREDGRPEVFQAVASRTMSSSDVESAQRRLPLRPFFFDVLRVDEHDYLDAPLHERVAAMEALLPAHQVVPRVVADDVATVERVFGEWVGQGYEGVVVKRLDAPYAAGRRDSAWVKLKPRHTFDLVVVAVEWGSGRRQGWLSNLHLAARDPERGFVMLGKTFKGLTDETLRWQTEHFLGLETSRTRHVVHVEPTTVVEIAIDGLQVSTRYPGGVALRFARVLRYRQDKSADEADLLETVRALAPVLPTERDKDEDPD
ncbi:DNA ligase-1 [Microlunatus sagamiharensis]|uniref:DNA ligase n=1 Tax=Microlunatus sagamiharensis TaxID=546874 RepID=A0A1H2MWB2_9ACTN|nr:ATP-dependent DNA ligase [Microlunatus sagamiharensis]SDU97537.1 DNA ligase-1 [Microlunatus sagamiharensis]